MNPNGNSGTSSALQGTHRVIITTTEIGKKAIYTTRAVAPGERVLKQGELFPKEVAKRLAANFNQERPGQVGRRPESRPVHRSAVATV